MVYSTCTTLTLDALLHRCVLGMDHHLPSLNSCIHHHNRKAFILSLIARCLWLTSWITLLLYQIVCGVEGIGDGKLIPVYVIVLSVLAVIIMTPWAVVLCAFTLFHLWLGSKNYTTIEFCEKRNAVDTKRYEKSGIKVRLQCNAQQYNSTRILNVCQLLFEMLNTND